MTDVVMPKMGESITEGTILEWKKQVGDSIAKDETLLEISTDKVDSEIPSPATGMIVEIIAQVNDTIPVGDVIARIGEVGESASTEEVSVETAPTEESLPTEPDLVPEIKEVVQSEIVIEKPIIQSGKRFYSPLVKSIAKKEGITQAELDALMGTGNNGRVNKQDILAHLKTRTAGAPTQTEDVIEQPASIVPTMSDEIEPMSRMRKRIAEHMVQSVQTSPHVYTTVEADVTNLVHIRAEHKESFKSKAGVNLTYTPMLLDACIRVIQEFPLMNASLDGDNIVHHRNINMGVAVALPDDNLIVPVIHSSEEKNFLGLARSVSDLAGRARENKLMPDEIFGSTFTITNPGVFGGLFGMGIINQPNVGILSVGSFQKRPVVKETEYGDTIVIRSMVYLTLSYDHRIIDGAYGTKFLARLVEIIEQYNNDKIKN
ncbi:MAG TPA: 2-oxo acid dehydrogenase subunit E2 [Candidatus Marinimicrobia bacterium]|nr:2-oxo acid dehydrogenase subunit E2 [Candidatus Neomarinimicrobiota bacterium]